MPQAVSTTSYNAANHQTSFGSQTLTYDLNGSIISDDANTYTWNACNQLVTISGAGLSASFSYDAFGRRISKTINGTTMSYLYDGANVVQEQQAGSASANMLTGGLDQPFTRTDSSCSCSAISDAVGSTVALTNTSGVVQTEYSYEPFGKTSVSGTSSGNAAKYTGREDDQTGLYFYRARYYSPSWQRFISEDPIGLAGGINLFAYVGNNPISFRDPFGLEKNDPWISEAQFCNALGVCGTAASGFADHITRFPNIPGVPSMGSVSGWLRGATPGADAVDESHGSYEGGGWAGVAWEIAASFAASSGSLGLRSTRINRIYSSRVLRRSAQEPGPYHNFPGSFDDAIFSGQRTVVSENYILYTRRGAINGVEGTFEIGVRPSASGRTEVIVHRFFRPDR